eukprot:SAG22_NODE_19879_length_271_cov_0.500000_1_plen_72_part_10
MDSRFPLVYLFEDGLARFATLQYRRIAPGARSGGGGSGGGSRHDSGSDGCAEGGRNSEGSQHGFGHAQHLTN